MKEATAVSLKQTFEILPSADFDFNSILRLQVSRRILVNPGGCSQSGIPGMGVAAYDR
ncbi:MAG: hypothetical protein U0905_18970 [Pirellulales bacterium]